MTSPTDVLREEHRIILRALDLLERATERVTGGGTLPEGWWRDVIGWLRTFADQTHHAKEEGCLFPAMLGAGLPSEGGPIAVMLEEHGHGRLLIQEMERRGPSTGVTAARKYIRHLREHIDKENGVLFPMADMMIDPQGQQAVAREFETVGAVSGRGASSPEAALERLASALAGVLKDQVAREGSWM